MQTRFVARWTPLLSLLRRPSSSSITTDTSHSTCILSPNELANADALIRRLCGSNHFQEAIRLLSATLLASPPLDSLPVIPFLADRLAGDGDNMSAAMSLLTTLRYHNPPPVPIIPFCSTLLISSYLRRRRGREAAKIFSWLLREDSPCRPDEETYRAYVGGMCMSEEYGAAAEAVKGVREMVRDGVAADGEVRGWVWRCLVREARVVEAKKLDAALDSGGAGGGDEVVKLIDGMLREWEE